MAETITTSSSQPGAEQANMNPTGKPQKKGPSLHEIYSRPAPLRTFPLPTFYPNNPISLLHITCVWISQAVRPPALEPSVIHHGVWSPATNSVHITSEESMRALWEQGFYGKASLSRSEPNWLKREQVKQGMKEGYVSELFTQQRREERQKMKWERAKLEQEAIQKTRLEEARRAEASRSAKLAPKATPQGAVQAPVGPLELLALPNSERDALGLLPAAIDDSVIQTRIPSLLDQDMEAKIPSFSEPPSPPISSSDVLEGKLLKHQKSVRFSPTVESTVFQITDPPSPSPSPPEPRSAHSTATSGDTTNESPEEIAEAIREIENKEHLQLTPEEAFWLTFGLGALRVTDPATGLVLSNQELLIKLRQNSYFPPKDGLEGVVNTDDNFLVQYAVYHHFRSLGWVPRAGVKFGVDWLLYTKGPVFDHAQFGTIVVPSYSDPLWKEAGKRAPPMTWRWMHNVVRVLSHVMKSLVLVYVNIPPPVKFEAKLQLGFGEALKLYKVREVPVKRWSANRNK